MTDDNIKRIKDFLATHKPTQWQEIKLEEPLQQTLVKLVAENTLLRAQLDAAAEREDRIAADAARIIGQACARHAAESARLGYDKFIKEFPKGCTWCMFERQSLGGG